MKATRKIASLFLITVILFSLISFGSIIPAHARTLYPTGCIPDTWQTILDNLAPPQSGPPMALPSSVDLNASFPDPGD